MIQLSAPSLPGFEEVVEKCDSWSAPFASYVGNGLEA